MSAWLDALYRLDRDVFLAVNGWLHGLGDRSPALESGIRLCNELGSAWILLWVLLGIVALEQSAGRAWRRALELGLAALAGGYTANRLKDLVGRSRPYVGMREAFEDGRAFRAFGEDYQSLSLPSGHTALAFSLAVLFAWWATDIPDAWRRNLIRVAVFAAASLTGLARIYTGSHYPLDVLAGATIGVLGAGVVVLLSRRALGPYPPLPPRPGPSAAP